MKLAIADNACTLRLHPASLANRTLQLPLLLAKRILDLIVEVRARPSSAGYHLARAPLWRSAVRQAITVEARTRTDRITLCPTTIAWQYLPWNVCPGTIVCCRDSKHCSSMDFSKAEKYKGPVFLARSSIS